MFSNVKIFAKILKRHEINFAFKLGVVLRNSEVICLLKRLFYQTTLTCLLYLNLD